jgi:hypothetical protein
MHGLIQKVKLMQLYQVKGIIVVNKSDCFD